MGGGKVKGQLSLGAVVTSVARQRMGKRLQCRLATHCHWVGTPAPPDEALYYNPKCVSKDVFRDIA